MATPKKRWGPTAIGVRDSTARQLIAAYRELEPLQEDVTIPAHVQVAIERCKNALSLAAMHLNIAGAGIQLDRHSQ